MESRMIQAMIFGGLAGGATIVGIYLTILRMEWVKKQLVHLISLSAGILLSTAILHLLPEAMENTSSALLSMLVSFLVFYFLEHSLSIHHVCEEDDLSVHPFGIVAMASLLLHSVIDGIIIGVGFGLSVELGMIATISVLLHEIPEGVITVSILLHAKYSREKTLGFSWIVALATPLGALLSAIFFPDLSQEAVGILLAIAAGSFLYVSASELIPEIHKETKHASVFFILVGVFIPFILGRLFE